MYSAQILWYPNPLDSHRFDQCVHCRMLSGKQDTCTYECTRMSWALKRVGRGLHAYRFVLILAVTQG